METEDQMRLELQRHSIAIFPENEADVSFIEDTLGLRAPGSTIQLVRVEATAMGFGSSTHLEAKPSAQGPSPP